MINRERPLCLSLGKGEVESSILSGSTISPNEIKASRQAVSAIRAIARRTAQERAVACGTFESQQVLAPFTRPAPGQVAG